MKKKRKKKDKLTLLRNIRFLSYARQSERKLTFIPSPVFGQVQMFFFRKFIASFVFVPERYIKKPFFLETTLIFFSYRSVETEKSSQKWVI